MHSLLDHHTISFIISPTVKGLVFYYQTCFINMKQLLLVRDWLVIYMNILRSNNQFRQIQELAIEIGKCSANSLPSKLLNLLKVIFPSEKLSPFGAMYEQGINSPNNKWIGKIKRIVQILSCKSPFGQAVMLNRDMRIDLQMLSLSSQSQDFLQQKMVIQGLNLQKQMNSVSIPILECFFIKLVSELVNLKEYERKSSFREGFQMDQFYFYIIRSPIMHLIKNWLTHSRTLPFIYNRILNVLEYFVIRQPIFKFRKNQNLTIRTHHFYAVYLLIQWKTTSIIWQFLSFIVEYLQNKQKNFNLIFSCWVRVHLVLLKRGSQYELNLRKNVQQALVTQRLSINRISSDSEQQMEMFYQQIKAIKDYNYLQNLSYQIQSLLNKQSYQPTPSFLATLLSIIYIFRGTPLFERSLLISQIGKAISKYNSSSKKKEDQMERIVTIVVSIYKRSGGDYVFYQEDESLVKGQRKISGLREKGSSVLANRRSFVTYQREVSPWQAPIKQSQSHALYALSYTLAKRIDKLLGRQQQKYPITNIRFLSSFKILAIILAILLILIVYP